jgi:hypothetical protein
MGHPDDFPGGVSCLSNPPEGGRDHKGRQLFADVVTELVGIVEAQAGERRLSAFEEFLSRRFRHICGEYDWEEVHDALADELKEKAESGEDRLSYYFIVSPKVRAADAALESLKRELPHLVFLKLKGSYVGDNRKQYSALRALMYQTSEHQV